MRVRGEPGLAGGGVGLEVLQLDHRRNQGDLALGHQHSDRIGQPGAMLDAVDARLDQLDQGLLPEDVGGNPAAELMGPLDCLFGHLGGQRGPGHRGRGRSSPPPA